ncbi:MAG: LptA/OstA family protein [Nibricoccus sp.]
MKLFATALLALLPLTPFAHAQSAPATVASPVDTVITSTYAEIWSNEAGTETYAIFKGDVVVTGTNLRITCDRIDATAIGRNDPAAKNTTAQNVEKFKTIVATGKVRIVQGDREANCERAEILPRESKIILTGQPVVIDHGTNAVAIGDRLILLKDQRRVQGDNVKITFPPVKDLGFDKNAPAPKPETDVAPAK